MKTSQNKFERYVQHPRYGKTPQITGLASTEQREEAFFSIGIRPRNAEYPTLQWLRTDLDKIQEWAA